VIGAPIQFSETEASVRTAPPLLGQHTDAVLTELGYDAGQIKLLRETRVI
jgi:crotonobetainyl-CoA:carnitine CoA-transferase CaiB-like acyl-CoA transferase